VILFMFISINTIYIIKFSTYLCSKYFCLLGLPFASLISIIAYSGLARVYLCVCVRARARERDLSTRYGPHNTAGVAKLVQYPRYT
jgi:hypothetical protein